MVYILHDFTCQKAGKYGSIRSCRIFIMNRMSSSAAEDHEFPCSSQSLGSRQSAAAATAQCWSRAGKPASKR